MVDRDAPKSPAPDDDPVTQKHKREIPSWLIYIAAAIAFYLVSPALFILVWPHGPPPDPIVRTMKIIYAPLEFLYHHVPWVRYFYDWLMELCRSLRNP